VYAGLGGLPPVSFSPPLLHLLPKNHPCWQHPDQTLLHTSIQLQGRSVIKNIGAFENILIT
jgi:hypothetical protein